MGIKKVKLNYKPIAVRENNEIAYEVDSTHVNAVNRSINGKIERNKIEQKTNYDAGNYIVKKLVKKI